ncbi:uncharacterized protein LY89DRAFT_741865 [Mollisia scopiformis]|uniref:Uncharacterized protein n=1 Tax=Mollisia scopiformis TaxID=149040 RepID=A0A132B7Y0_MOLSC|nr:uncharacterized protein LY89DRAFT_741865 [Mollisia scopiformis]KUJ08505.1 hypothetical protein LY89DRAFT_741865 [Mollisia scopiformis]
MSFLLSILAIVSYTSFCEALVPDFPDATPIQDPLFNPVGWSPKPTPPPKIPRDLFYKRDYLSNSASYVLIGPDQTCGYVSGLAGANFECGSSTNCVFFPVTGSSAYGAVGCCTDALNCGFRTACVDSSGFYGSDSPILLLHTVEAFDMLYQEQLSSNISAMQATSTWQTAFTTYSGESGSRTFTSVARALLEKSAASASSTSSSSSSSSSTNKATTTSSSSSSSSTSGTSAPTPTQTSNNNNKSSDTGAIVGGLVGGAAVLGLIGAGAFFLYKRKYGQKGNPPSPSHTPLNNLDPSKPAGQWQQDGFYAPQQQPQPYLSSFQTQYHPVPVEMPSDFAQRPPEHMVHEKSATTPTTANMSTPMDQHYMSPASTYNRPISEIDSSSPNYR